MEINTTTSPDVIQIRLSELYEFKNHPFSVRDDADMAELTASIAAEGVMNPIIVRFRAEGGYEIIAGHRRRRASELAGLETIPALIRELDDDEAISYMVDTNLSRTRILPSEKAFAYKMKLYAIKRKQGRRPNSAQAEQDSIKKYSIESIGESVGESCAQVQRYIRLTYLHPVLLRLTDDERIPFLAAVELSYLRQNLQVELADLLSSQSKIVDAPKPVILQAQAQRIRKQSSANEQYGYSEMQIADEEAARKERRRVYQREYQREWQKKHKTETAAAM